MAHLQKRDEYKGSRPNQATWLAEQGIHQRLAALLAADESDEFSTDTEQRVYNAVLTTLYRLVGHKVPPIVMNMVVSPGFMKELAAEKPAKSLSFVELTEMTAKRTPEEIAADEARGPLGKPSTPMFMPEEEKVARERARERQWRPRYLMKPSLPKESKLSETPRMPLMKPPISSESPAGSAEKPVAAASTLSMPAVAPSPIE